MSKRVVASAEKPGLQPELFLQKNRRGGLPAFPYLQKHGFVSVLCKAL